MRDCLCVAMSSQVVTRLSCYVVLAFGTVCLLYGAYATHYTMGIYLADAGEGVRGHRQAGQS